MARESLKAKSLRAGRIIGVLAREFPGVRVALDYSSPLELLVATILSAQCTDQRVNLVTRDLFRKYRRAADYAAADLPRLEEKIKPTGFFRNKARSVKALGQALVERFDGEVPRTMEELVTLPGVGRKTANVVLGNAFGLPGIAVDTHVGRVGRRLGLTDEEDPVKAEFDLMEVVPKKEWTRFSLLLIAHGRKTCQARKPLCPKCSVGDLCPSRPAFMKEFSGGDR